ncbi:HlyD family efflux transporter periplasmic adaptor subunit [Butyrivibrio sp. AE2032]|uniref:HlyD family efflux transporter periplasmic adaptor subunit n=1 Tax=Butyrivibrio sp. AE2032 TaxID=1458463 RepID=UPI0005534323|nr:HlyD family efflux transporter periplasmic adaptor subunit [Butyrivibrio sp. AE2032]
MADGKQWYNSPEGQNDKKQGGKLFGGKKQGKPSSPQQKMSSGKTGVAPAGKQGGKPSAASGMKSSGRPVQKAPGKPVSGNSGKPVQKTSGRPMQNMGKTAGSAGRQPVKQGKGAQPVKGSAKRQVNGKPASGNGQQMPYGVPYKDQNGKDINLGIREKSIIPQMDKSGVSSDVKQQNIGTKASAKQQGRDAKASSNQRAEDLKYAKAKSRAEKQERDKVLEKQKRLEQAKIKEQQKIEKNEHKRKNPSQKSAEGRAVRNGFLGAVVVAAALFVLVFVIHHLYDFLAEKPNFSFVTTGAVEHTIGARALIVRDEDVITSTNAGELVTQITEGSRVAKGQELAIVVPEEMKSVVQDLRNVQSQISDVQQELIMQGGVAEADTIYRNYNKNLSAILDSVRFDAMSGNLTNMSSYGSSVNVILDEREDEMSRIDFEDDRISVLRTDEKVYEAQVEKYASVISAHRPGIVSFRLDGKEQLLNYNMFLAMPASEIKSYINNSVGAISSDLSVEADTAVVRIAQNESQYLTVYLSANDAAVSDFAIGTLHDINVRTEGLSIDNCKVVRCESDASGMLITFETSRYVEDLLDLRTVDIEIVITETDGMRVSVPSLVNADYVQRGSTAFCVYFYPDELVSEDTFAEGSMFNVTIMPKTQNDNGEALYEDPEDIPPNSSVGGCSVIHTESFENGGLLVAFATPNDYSNLKKLDRIYSKGYTANFVDTATGLGKSSKKIMVSDYSGIASVYTNNQGFVEEVRVILLDNDREFAIIDQVGNASVPNLDTVIITNPKTVKPGDKVD